MDNKVIYARCENYNTDDIDKALEFIFNSLPGFEEKITKAHKILIKPNLLAPRPPSKAITTHPDLLICLIKKLQAYDVEILLADTPAGNLNEKVMNRLYTVTEMKRVAETTGIKLNMDFSEFKAESDHFKTARSQKILQVAEDADIIINVAKLKTHCFTMLTCATKNYFGIIPGLLKMKYHLTIPEVNIFASLLLDIERYFQPKAVNIVDGIVGMEGNGPGNGTPIRSNCLLASYDAIYLDILACHIMGIDPEKIKTITEAFNRNLIKGKSVDDLDVISNAEVETLKFKLPPDRDALLPSFIPGWLRNIINRIFIPDPVINADKCIGCKACAEGCPPQVIKMIESKAYITDYKNCIRCYCCQEVCPNDAIALEKPAGRKIMEVLRLK
jgi:uncharacterized protein (DUF362 family)/Pyruvate/2-oxoacid:ferredoxin oxidoreductase delta subunit